MFFFMKIARAKPLVPDAGILLVMICVAIYSYNETGSDEFVFGMKKCQHLSPFRLRCL